MPRIISKKMKRKSKKGVSWSQGGRNRKLIGKVNLIISLRFLGLKTLWKVKNLEEKLAKDS